MIVMSMIGHMFRWAESDIMNQPRTTLFDHGEEYVFKYLVHHYNITDPDVLEWVEFVSLNAPATIEDAVMLFLPATHANISKERIVFELCRGRSAQHLVALIQQGGLPRPPHPEL